MNAKTDTVRGYALSTDPGLAGASLNNYADLVSITVPSTPDNARIYGRYYSTTGAPSNILALDVDLAAGTASSANVQPGVILTHSLVKLPDDGNAKTQEDSAVYYVGTDGKRHAFPNPKIYFSWYADFSGVMVISAADLASVPLGANVRYKPGSRMVKFTTDPKAYAVDAHGVLRWVVSEEVAKALYGDDWAKKIDDLSDAFFGNYSFGSDINTLNDYNVDTAFSLESHISDDLGL